MQDRYTNAEADAAAFEHATATPWLADVPTETDVLRDAPGSRSVPRTSGWFDDPWQPAHDPSAPADIPF